MGQVHKPKYQRDHSNYAKDGHPTVEGVRTVLNVDDDRGPDKEEGGKSMADIETVVFNRHNLAGGRFYWGGVFGHRGFLVGLLTLGL